MTLQDWAAFALSITSLIGAFALMIRWMVKHYLTELKPNGGSSVSDRLNRVEGRVDDIYNILSRRTD
jgi:phenylacetate-coenzyme A ligase PaaK-like adenylate-forming protein